MIFPNQLIANSKKTPERTAWLESLPELLEELTERWSLRVDPPFDHPREDWTNAPWIDIARKLEPFRF